MKQKLLKNAVALVAMTLIIAPAFALALPVQAQGDLDVWAGGDSNVDVEGTLGLGNRDPREIAAAVINVIMGFLGIVAVIIILLGGFKWMTAQGNEEKVSEAKNLIIAGIIGLVIILAAFAIAKFVLAQLLTATTSTTST